MTSPNYILIADDDHKIRALLVRVVQNVAPNAVIVQATSGTEALSALQQHSFTLVITDYHMPGASALDILAATHARDADVPVIVVSARSQVEPKVRAAGAAAFFSKPFEIEALTAIVRRALHSS
ncbi:MAG TPA: response regulator [Herpetosiphonaceae bacterium]